MDSSRIKQINELIMQKLSFILRDQFLGSIFSITEVKTSPDLTISRIYVSVISDDKSIIEEMNLRSSQIRKSLSKKIKLRHTPKIQFLLDKTEEYAEKMDKLFKKL